MKKVSFSVLLMTLLMFSTIVLSAQKNDNQKPKVIPNLTETQREDVKNIREKTEKENQPIRTELQNSLKKHDELMKKEKADMNAINNNLKVIADKRLVIAKNLAKMHQDTRVLLDEEQRNWYDANRLKSPNTKKGKAQNNKKGKNK